MGSLVLIRESGEGSWRTTMPVGDLLILVCNVQQAMFAEVGANQLHAGGQAVDFAAGVRQRRNAGQVNANGVDVG